MYANRSFISKLFCTIAWLLHVWVFIMPAGPHNNTTHMSCRLRTYSLTRFVAHQLYDQHHFKCWVMGFLSCVCISVYVGRQLLVCGNKFISFIALLQHLWLQLLVFQCVQWYNHSTALGDSSAVTNGFLTKSNTIVSCRLLKWSWPRNSEKLSKLRGREQDWKPRPRGRLRRGQIRQLPKDW